MISGNFTSNDVLTSEQHETTSERVDLHDEEEYGELPRREYKHDDSTSTGLDRLHYPHTHDAEQHTNGAEHLVKREASVIRILRASMIVLLITATVLTGIFTHRLAAKNEKDSFTRDYQNLASQIVQTFEGGIRSYLAQAFTLSEAISGGIYAGSKPDFPEVTLQNLDGLTSSLRLQALALDIIWSPLLRNRSERSSWEKYAVSSLQNSSSSSNGQDPPCHFCGAGKEALNPNNPVYVPSAGTFTCKAVQQAALTGFLNPSLCISGASLFQSSCGCKDSPVTTTPQTNITSWNVSDGIFRLLNNGTAVQDHGPTPFSPVWQVSPSSGGKDAIMFNQMSDPPRRKAISEMIRYNIPVLSQSVEPTTSNFYKLLQTPASADGLVGALFYPVYESTVSNKIAGSLSFDFSWQLLFGMGLTDQSDGIVIVLENTCGQVYTFKVVGNQVEFLGAGDLHDTSFDSMVLPSSTDFLLSIVSSSAPRGGLGVISPSWGCAYSVRIYPSSEIRSRYLTSKPWVETIVVVAIFVFTSSVFLLYDLIVRRLQAKVLKSAKRSEAIVTSMFPSVVWDRLFHDGPRTNDIPSNSLTIGNGASERLYRTLGHGLLNHKVRLKSYLSHPPSLDLCREPEPIADLFPNTTILFADIEGFTAWSSEREPPQVFKLLETLYTAFDEVAHQLGVFKVETIGDCYVAVSGLPDPEKDHAVIMVKFAYQCLLRMHDLTRTLESSLGPGTADLKARVGLHSGPVTAGVLRGERARFQLFGDTVNVASRMESTGKVNRIQVSKETAQLLIEAGKSDWVEERNELVAVKGKGQMQTYWACPKTGYKRKRRDLESSLAVKQSLMSLGDSTGALSRPELKEDFNVWGATNLDTALALRASSTSRTNSLTEWNADILQQLLQKVVAKRNALMKRRNWGRQPSFLHAGKAQKLESRLQVVDEITEIIAMPAFDESGVMDSTSVDLGLAAQSQLRDFVARIASLYKDNAFHNFEHASHVAMSASKLLKRIITPDDLEYRADETGKRLKSRKLLSREIHDTTFGISSDPLMQFAVLFSALIHDVDHRGVTNKQLVNNNDPLAVMYHGKCVAEQHSIQRAWQILMEEKYADLRQCIYQTDEDQLRFRQFLINAVIATDIADKELQIWRKSRWNKAFHGEKDSDAGALPKDSRTMMDCKATIVFEYIIQASDVAHTMQHWHIYKKWNQRLFDERYVAFVNGKDNEDPSTTWYKGELWFFDNYVIPLAGNLKECNVFGVSCDEFLTYAVANRHEWELKGEEIVSEMVASFGGKRSNLVAPEDLAAGGNIEPKPATKQSLTASQA
jgi:class 3 adenylate cyclase